MSELRGRFEGTVQKPMCRPGKGEVPGLPHVFRRTRLLRDFYGPERIRLTRRWSLDISHSLATNNEETTKAGWARKRGRRRVCSVDRQLPALA